MLRVLIVITTSFTSSGGLATVMLNYYRSLDKTDILIDFASTNQVDKALMNELAANGSHYYCLGNRKARIEKYCCNLFRVIKNNKYDVIHVNGNSSTMLIELGLAKLLGIKKRIAHCHTSKSNYPLLNRILHPIFKRLYTDAISVSMKSGKWIFGERFTVLNNAINIDEYSYNEKLRNQMRLEYGFEKNNLILGNVGKLNKPKNHSFLLDVFAKYVQQDDTARLVIVGGGELEEALKEKVSYLSLDNKVIFTGMVENTSKYLQMMDVFLFPSVFEGLGMALIEAQASGLPCFSSKAVPEESNVTGQVKYLSLDINEWVEALCELCSDLNKRDERSDLAKQIISDNGYDIRNEAKNLELIYRGRNI